MDSVNYDIIYYCDAYPGIGMGHLKRGMDVLHTVRSLQPEFRLAVGGCFSDPAHLFIDEFLDPSIDILGDGDRRPSKVSVLDTMFEPEDPGVTDLVTADSIKNASQIQVMVSSALTLDVPDSVDVVIDHLPDLVIRGNRGVRKHVGFAFAPIAPSIVRGEQGGSVTGEGVLAVLGGGAVSEGPQRLLSVMTKKEFLSLRPVTLVVSPLYSRAQLEGLRSGYTGIEILQSVPNLVPYFKKARIVISTYGNATYESLGMHKAAFTLNGKKFQNTYADYLESKGLVINLGTFDDIREDRLGLLLSEGALKNLEVNSSRVFSGSGIDKIAQVLLEEHRNAS